jgi:muconolactone delta-isomerase
VKLLVICRPAAGVDPDQIAPHAAEEMAALRELKAHGSLLDAYSPGWPGAILILDTDPAQIDQLLASLPLYRHGLIDTETIELHPFEL